MYYILLRFKCWWHDICYTHGTRKAFGKGNMYCAECDKAAYNARQRLEERLIAESKATKERS